MTLNAEARPRRLVPRYPLAQEVVVRVPGMKARSYPARDVSQGGFFLVTEDAFELFCDVELDVPLPGNRSATLKGRVVHLLSREQAVRFGATAGIGVQFEGLSPTQLAHVDELVMWARSCDSRPRTPRRRPGAGLDAVRGEPLLAYVLGYIDGKRDPEALAEELGIEVGTVERMLRELSRLALIELVPANGGEVSQTPPPRALPRDTPSPPATAETSDPAAAAQLDALERRLAEGNHYRSLDVPEDAGSEMIRAAFQALSAALSLARAPAAEVARAERLHARLRAAYGVLSSAHKRNEYDTYLARGRRLAQAEADVTDPRPPVRAQANAAKPDRRRRPTERRPALAPSPRRDLAGQRLGSEPPLGAAAQVLAEAQHAVNAGKLMDACKHLQLLTAMKFDDTQVRARVARLKAAVMRSLAVDFEKQAAYEERQQRWEKAAHSWLRVAEGRPKDSLPLQRAAQAQLQAGGDLRLVMEVAKRAVELAADDPQARRVLARVYVAAGMQANARRELEAAQRCKQQRQTSTITTKQASLFKRMLGRDAPN